MSQTLFRHLTIGNVGLRTCHEEGFTVLMARHDPARLNPVIFAVRVFHAVFMLELRSFSFQVRVEPIAETVDVLGMNATEPFLRCMFYRRGFQSKQRAPTGRKLHSAVFEVPFPKTVIGARRNQRITRVALRQRVPRRIAFGIVGQDS